MENKKVIFKKINNIQARIFSDHPNIINDLIKYMALYAENYRFMPKYKMGIWDGKIRFVDNSGIFNIGLLNIIYNFVSQYDYTDIEFDDALIEKNENFEDEFNELTTTWLNESLVPRDYQLEGSLKAIKYKRGVLEHATSAGKSLTLALIVMYLLLSKKCKKILILVPTVNLVEQMNSDFKSYGISEEKIGLFYEKEKNVDRLITISTWQSIHIHKDILKEFDAIFCDEAHMQKADIIRSVCLNAINCEYRIGTTGTLSNLPKVQKYLIEGVLGPIIHNVPPGFLIENGYASDVNIKSIFLKYPESIIKNLKGLPYHDEVKWIEQYLPRNKIIYKLCEKHINLDHNVLILVDHLEHGETILNYLQPLKTKNCELFLVTGATDGKIRENVRQYVNKNKRCIIIGTYGVFSTGVSINRLHSLIFAIAGKSMVRVMQSIGRGMRLHKEKTKVLVYDICDSFKYSQKHLEERIIIYDNAGYKFDMKEIEIKD